MGARHRASERVGEIAVDAPGRRQTVERLVLVEAPHLDRPFDRLARSVDREAAVSGSRNRHHAPVDCGRVGAVDLDLGRAGAFAFFQRRVIEERKPHRALDLEGAWACQEHRGGMGVDAGHRLATVDFRPGEEVEDCLLRVFAHGVT